MQKIIKVAGITILLMMMSLCIFMIAGCENHKNDRPKSTLIKVYHPIIEEPWVNANSYRMKYDGKPKVFDIKIYCVQDKRYLTDDDMVRKDLNSLIVVAVKKDEETISARIDITQPDEWPTEIGKYHITIDFNGGVRDDSVLDPNYYAAPMIFFDLFIEEESFKD